MKPPEIILVVDDEEAGRFVKVQRLRRAGFTVLEAATGSEGLALVESRRPALIVLDVNLPDMSGFDVARRLRVADPGPPTIQILQISQTAIETADRVRGLQEGADVYLTEPVDGEVLVATVHALLRVRRAEAALADALERERRARSVAEDASRLKDEFIATLSHELRTPLNALMGWIWQLKHTSLSEDARVRALDSLERNARTQAQLINDLLDVSRISKGKLRLEIRLVDLQSVVREAVENLREPSERKNVEVVVHSAPVHVTGDHGRLQQIVTNLLTNALQFTPPRGRITVSVASDDGDAVLRVQDTGVGIDPSLLPHVFDPFRQGESGLSRQHGGLGLGLAVVRQLVELHGGTATVESGGLEQGATFIVRLPRETELNALGGGESHLLLDKVTIAITAEPNSDYGNLKATLESSGGHVTLIPAGSESTTTADVVLSREAQTGCVIVRLAGLADDEPPHIIAESAPPAEIVRQMARLLAASRTS